MKAFKYYKADSVQSAISILKENKNIRVIAGGTDIIGTLHSQIQPQYLDGLVSLKNNQELAYIKEDQDGLKVGSMVRLSEIQGNPIIKDKYNLLAEAAHTVASPQIRNMATIGGNICQEPRCWYYRYPDNKFGCLRKGGNFCNAFTGNNLYHSIFGSMKICRTPCEVSCPNGTNISKYMSLIREGNLNQAAEELLKVNPISSVTGRVCPHDCQNDCNRNEYDSAVSIRNVERYLGDYILDNQDLFMRKPVNELGKNVAIIGSGPAGLTAAFYLRLFGYSVTVFDLNEQPGGMLTYAIPAYRLPKDIICRLVDMLKSIGVMFKLGAEVNEKTSIAEYKLKYDAVFVGCGAWGKNNLNLEGEKYTITGLDFLYRCNTKKQEQVGKNVVVIGGGNVAIDVATSALRLGSKNVTIVYRRTKDEMPAHSWEVEEALREGVKLMTSLAPSKVLVDNGIVKGLEVVKSTSKGKRNSSTILDTESKTIIDADCVIMAIGQKIDSGIFSGMVETANNGAIVINTDNQATSMEGVYAAGDVVSGPATVVEAVAGGRKAAKAIHIYFNNDSIINTDEHQKIEPDASFDMFCLNNSNPIKMPMLDIKERELYKEDALGLSLEDVKSEVDRCFNCGCVAVSPSDIAPALIAMNSKIKTTLRTIEAEDFFAARMSSSTVLEDGEIVLEIQIPTPEKGNLQIYKKFRARKSIDFPVVGVAVNISLNGGCVSDARIVLGAVKPIPFRVTESEDFLRGKVLNEENAETAASLAIKHAIPLMENSYKINITKALVKRAILGIHD